MGRVRVSATLADWVRPTIRKLLKQTYRSSGTKVIGGKVTNSRNITTDPERIASLAAGSSWVLERQQTKSVGEATIAWREAGVPLHNVKDDKFVEAAPTWDVEERERRWGLVEITANAVDSTLDDEDIDFDALFDDTPAREVDYWPKARTFDEELYHLQVAIGAAQLDADANLMIKGLPTGLRVNTAAFWSQMATRRALPGPYNPPNPEDLVSALVTPPPDRVDVHTGAAR